MDTARTTAAVDPASIAGLFKGIVSVREENGFIMPLRLTEKQLERYKGIPRCCYPYATAGIKLDFITDADEIGFIYHTVNFCCLLYTSPSPRDRTRSRMPSSA